MMPPCVPRRPVRRRRRPVVSARPGAARTSSRKASERASRSSMWRTNRRSAFSASSSTAGATRSAAMASMSRRRYALSSFSASSDSRVVSAGGPGCRGQSTPPSAGTQRNSSVLLERPVALDAAVDLGAHAQRVGQAELEPARHPARRHAVVEQLERCVAATHRPRTARSSTARSASSPMYQAVAADSSRSRRLSHASDTLAWVMTSKVRPRTSWSWSSANGSTEPPMRLVGLPHALGDGLDLAVLRGQQRQDPVRLAQLEAAEDDGRCPVHARDGHGGSVRAGRSIQPARNRTVDERRHGRVPRCRRFTVAGCRRACVAACAARSHLQCARSA